MTILAVLAFGIFIGYIAAILLIGLFSRNARSREDELEDALIAIERETRCPTVATMQRIRTKVMEVLQ